MKIENCLKQIQAANKEIALLVGAIQLELAIGRELGSYDEVVGAVSDLFDASSSMLAEAQRINSRIKEEVAHRGKRAEESANAKAS